MEHSYNLLQKSMFKKLLNYGKKKIKKKTLNFLFYNNKKINFKILFSIKEKKIVNIFILNSVLIIKLFTCKM